VLLKFDLKYKIQGVTNLIQSNHIIISNEYTNSSDTTKVTSLLQISFLEMNYIIDRHISASRYHAQNEVHF